MTRQWNVVFLWLQRSVRRASTAVYHQLDQWVVVSMFFLGSLHVIVFVLVWVVTHVTPVKNWTFSEMMSFEYNVDENKTSRDNLMTVLRRATFCFADHGFWQQNSEEVWHMSLHGALGNQPWSCEMSLVYTAMFLRFTVLLHTTCHEWTQAACSTADGVDALYEGKLWRLWMRWL